MHDDGHPAHHEFPVETEQPKNSRLLIYGLAIGATFFTSGIVLTSLFYRANTALQVARGTHPSYGLVELREVEQDHLGTYAWVDKAKGEVRIPIDRAMRLVVEDAQKK